MTLSDFAQWMADIQARTEDALGQLLPPSSTHPDLLHEAMRYAVLGGGKRVRALLVHGAGEIAGATANELDRAAAAVELIHAYSLVHDDMPCMDDDALRRGKPTVHVEYDEATALLTGDALQTMAFEVLCGAEDACAETLPAERRIAMIRLLAQASGSRGMAGGQAIDLASVGLAISLEELEFMHIRKTGALIRASVLLGAQCGNCSADTLERLDRYGKLVGLLFQVVDDILDANSDTATLGKTAGKDADNNKPTYVSLLGLGEARKLADSLLDETEAALVPLGHAATRLRELAGFIVHRRF
ncbi:MAG TPA: polyprenyl synthetase family protein [Azoarcus taiwanensis]|nr:polyprenyl synthetase family protein [Azoarcus taiwanensis]